MNRISIYMACIAVLAFSCSTGSNKETQDKTAVAEMKSAKKYSGMGDQNKMKDTVHAVNFQTPAAAKGTVAHEDWDKKIIKTAEVDLELKDYAGYNQSIHKSLKIFGAYIASEDQHLSDDRNANNITIKVPVEQFENLMNSFSGEGIKVLQKKITSEDVTGEVVDTRSRLEAKKQMRERYLDLLKQARNMKEILEVQAEINAIQEDIESASGRVGYLNHQSAYSTIHLHYFQYSDPGAKAKDPSGFLVRLKESFSNGIQILGSLLIFIVTIWPLLLAGAIFFVIAWKKRKIKIVNP